MNYLTLFPSLQFYIFNFLRKLKNELNKLNIKQETTKGAAPSPNFPKLLQTPDKCATTPTCQEVKHNKYIICVLKKFIKINLSINLSRN